MAFEGGSRSLSSDLAAAKSAGLRHELSGVRALSTDSNKSAPVALGTDSSNAHYDSIAEGYEKAWFYEGDSPYQKWMVEQLLDVMSARADDCVIDLGCGSGNFTAALEETLRPSCGFVVGVDPSPGMIDAARRLDGVVALCADGLQFSTMTMAEIARASEARRRRPKWATSTARSAVSSTVAETVGETITSAAGSSSTMRVDGDAEADSGADSDDDSADAPAGVAAGGAGGAASAGAGVIAASRRCTRREADALAGMRYNKVYIKEVVHHIPPEELDTMLRNLHARLPDDGTGRVVIVTRMHDSSHYPFFAAAHRVWEEQQDRYEVYQDACTRAGFDTETVVRSYAVRMPTVRWLAMVQDRFWSTFSAFDDDELADGVDEIRRKYEGCEEIEFPDKLCFIVATRRAASAAAGGSA